MLSCETSVDRHTSKSQVPPFIPYSLKKSDTEIWGRGSVDAKACVAAQTIAALTVINATLASKPPSLSLLFVVGEETAGTGMLYFSDHAPTNYTSVLFGEPTEGRLVSGHKGMLSFKLNVTGKAAHSGYPWLGLSATSVLVEALSTLNKLEPSLPRSDSLGATTVNIGRIDGGVAANVVAEHAAADVSVRIAAGSPARIKSLIRDALKPLKECTEDAGGSLEITYSNRAYGPVHMDTNIPGFEKDAMSVNYGTDVPNLSGTHKRYLWGPGSIFVAHGPREHLLVNELADAVGVYEKMIRVILDR
jgi:acetylornithine deacetylase